MPERISNFLANRYFLLVLGACVVASFFLVAEPVSLDRGRGERSLKIAENALGHVERFYVEGGVNYAEMLEKGVSSLEVALDDVLVEFPRGSSEGFTVRVGDRTRKFGGADPSSPGELESVLGKAVSFALSSTGAAEDRIENVEYSVVDGMLKALDPHSAMISPEIYREFLVDTEGSFGGLGIVVGIRDGQLTVISPIEGTPAHGAGIRAGDRIVQIENESTVSMPLLEAVGKLRGKKGTRVNILVSRKNFPRPRKFSIVRNTIKIESVEGFDLEDGILYLRIRNFQKNTFSDLRKEVAGRPGGPGGIILDLRGNPGGLLSQAEDVADFFLSSGTIMTTRAKNYSQTHVSSARRPEYGGKVVVLIDQGSASASEIVAGALKNNRRALVVGSRSFGKGSVQKVFDFEDGSALKLTIANYLTPGDVSIQDRGVTPDVLVQGVLVTDRKVVYDPLPEKRENAPAERPETPSLTVRHLDPSLGDPDDGEEPRPDETLGREKKLERIRSDFHVKLAGGMLSAETRGEMLSAARGLADAELEKIRAEIEKTGIDWSAGKTENPSVSVETVPPRTVFEAGDENFLTVRVTNTGKSPVYRLRAVTDCENAVYRDGEMLFGKLLPGESRTARVGFSVPRWTATREDRLKLVMSSGEVSLPERSLAVRTLGVEPPVYSYNYEVVDDGRLGSGGNGNGFAEVDEKVALRVRIRNVGTSDSSKTVATLRNLSGKDVFLEEGRFEFEDFRPGETREAPFRFRQSGGEGEARFELVVTDEDFREVRTQKITLPVAAGGKRPFAPLAGKTAVFRSETRLLGGSFAGARPRGVAGKNSRVRILGTSEGWTRVEGKNSVSGWVSQKSLRTAPGGGGGAEVSALEETFENPPALTVGDVPFSTAAAELRIEGSVADDDRVASVAVWRGGDKVRLFTPGKKKAPLFFPLELEEGMNLFTIVARDERGMISKKTLAVRRDFS